MCAGHNDKTTYLNMIGDECLGYQSLETRHSSSHMSMTVLFMMMKLLEFLQMIQGVDTNIMIPDNIPLVIVEFIIVLIKIVMMVDLDIGFNRPLNLTI